MNNRVLTGSTQSANDTVYLHTDHLGSVEATTNALGQFVNRMSFGAWGERQKSDWKPGAPAETFLTTNGFTGHDQLDSHNLVHMDGRVYDPNLGRFLSADLLVQSPYNSQSYNRYSYTFNNPGSFVDPTGYGCTTHYFHTYVHDPFGNKIPMGDTTQTTCDNEFYNQPDYNNGFEDFQLPQLTLNDYLDYASQQQATGVIAPLEGDSVYGAFALVVEDASLGIVWGETGSILAFKSTPQIEANKDAARKGVAGVALSGFSLVATVAGPGKFTKSAKNAYSVYFETSIAKTGAGTRESHKAAANRSLAAAMEDKSFAQLMQKLGVNPVGGKNTPNGFIWHHSAERPGVMQLVPDSQHVKGSDFWSILHPGGSGGFANWGRNW